MRRSVLLYPDHAKLNPFPVGIHVHHSDHDMLVDGHDFCRIGDVSFGQLGEVYKAILLDTYIDEPEPECVEVPEKKTAVYGCSYDKKEILENRLDGVRPEGKMKYHLLLAHGGDARHMPWNPGRMAQAGFDYIACGHIHKPGILIPDKMAYAGALEPTDETQLQGRICTEWCQK